MSTLSRRAAALAIASVAAAAAALAAAPANAAHPLSCGDTIVADTVLTADLVCDGSTDGLVIGADGITLDLKGHTISGPGAYATGLAGIRVAQHVDVIVTRGTVTGWQSGVVLDQSQRVTVSKIVALSNDLGVNLAGGRGHVVKQSTILQNGRDGVRLGGSHENLITQNAVDGNTWGITVANGSSSNTVSRNDVTDSQLNGIAAFDGAAGTTVSQNTVSASGGIGVHIQPDTSGTLLLQNKSSGNGGDGFSVWNATVTKNTAIGNAGHGIVATASVDGGGDKAGSNGLMPDCIGVVCSAP